MQIYTLNTNAHWNIVKNRVTQSNTEPHTTGKNNETKNKKQRTKQIKQNITNYSSIYTLKIEHAL